MPSLQADPLLGSVVDGKYHIVERIGAGGMGAVYRAIHVSLGAPRAVKVMRPELAQDAALAARFRTEARLAESLRHQNLVALFDFGDLPDGGCYIVSEFVEGATLAVLLRRRGARFASRNVATWVGEIAEGLALAHRRGIVHRDISPDNIMLTARDGETSAKLLDFGIAKDTLRQRLDSVTAPGWNVGKVGFSSPEQMGLLRDGETVDARSDVFSLAAVAYLMVAGRLPWRKGSVQSYTHDLLVRPEEELRAEVQSHVSDPWRSVFTDALARTREARITDMPTLRDRMRDAARIASEAGIEEPPPFSVDMLRASGRGDDSPPVLATHTLGQAAPGAVGAWTPSPLAMPLAPGGALPSAPATPASLAAASLRSQATPVLVPSSVLHQDMARFDAEILEKVQAVDPSDPAQRPEGTRCRLVLLDDDATVRDLLPGLLGANFDVAAAPWRGDSLDFAATHDPDLILLDIDGGANAADRRMARLRDDPRLKSVPVAFFSSADEWTLRGLARRCSATGYVTKSSLARDVGGTLSRLVDGLRSKPSPT